LAWPRTGLDTDVKRKIPSPYWEFIPPTPFCQIAATFHTAICAWRDGIGQISDETLFSSWLGDWDLIPGRGRECSPLPPYPDQPWDPPSLLSNGCQGLFPQEQSSWDV